MLIHSRRIGTTSLFIVICAALGSVCGSSALAQQMSLSDLVKHVKPSVALIEIIVKGKTMGNGSGYVVDPSGIIATNYHVVEGASELRVSFPGDTSLGSFKAEGFIAFYQKKDMALIKIDPKGKKLRPLPLAKELPSQGDEVVAFGAPLGYSDTVTNGIVSAVRTGKELTSMMSYGGHDGYGKDGLGYEVNTTWIQTSAPISPGNSGGPLVNMKGEVVGMNTFVSTRGQNLNFSLSITHMIKFIADSGKNVKPFSDLPPPREGHGGGPSGDAKKTLALWKALNRAKNHLDQEIEACERKFQKLPPIDPRNPMKGSRIRNRKIADGFKKLSDAYSTYSSDISHLDQKEADIEVIKLVVQDTVVAKKLSDLCKDVSNTASAGTDEVDWQRAISAIKDAGNDTDTHRELLRVNLGLMYNLSFPTQKDTAEEDKKLPKDKKATKSTTEKKDRSLERVWTDASGKFHIRAKCIGVEGGIVKLEKPDGTVLNVPKDKLSEEDKLFLDESE